MVPAALVTGTSTGIGRACAARLARAGWRVFASVRQERDAADLLGAPSSGPGRVTPLVLDVADPGSIAAAAGRLSDELAGEGLAVLVNNAGILVPGPVEFVDDPAWRRQFDVNLFGPVELTRRLLPLLRRRVELAGPGSARIVLVGSIGGRVSQPINAPYTASKAALAAVGDALRLELRPQGVRVSVVEPGAVATPIWSKGDDSARRFGPNHPARALYGPEIDGLARAAARFAAAAIPPDAAADAVLRCLSARRPPARLLVGRDARVMALLARVLPARGLDAVLTAALGLRSRRPSPTRTPTPRTA